MYSFFCGGKAAPLSPTQQHLFCGKKEPTNWSFSPIVIGSRGNTRFPKSLWCCYMYNVVTRSNRMKKKSHRSNLFLRSKRGKKNCIFVLPAPGKLHFIYFPQLKCGFFSHPFSPNLLFWSCHPWLVRTFSFFFFQGKFPIFLFFSQISGPGTPTQYFFVQIREKFATAFSHF